MRALALGLLATAVTAAPAWVRFQSPHFELFTDAGAKPAANLLDALESVRQVFLDAIGGKAPALPVRVFLFDSERDFRRFEPNRAVGGFHQGGPERDYIVLSGPAERTLRAARHEYLHVMMAHTSGTLPLWLEEGTAELYSTLAARDAHALLGSPVEEHVRALNRVEWLSPAAFAGLKRKARLLDNPEAAGLFYAQSWALVHMLNFSPAWRSKLPRYVELLDGGEPSERAFPSAFEAPLERALAEARIYVRTGRFGTARIQMAAREAFQPEASPLTEAAVSIAEAELFTVLGNPAAATPLLAKAAKAAPEAATETALGLLALARRETAEAKARFASAIRLGAKPAIPYFEYAMLLREGGASDEEVRKYLGEAVGRNPNLAEAHFILGLMAQQEGRHREAVAAFEEATRVLPRQSYFWHARALSHRELGQTELAKRAAMRAAASAATEAQLEMARGALRLMDAPAESARPAESRPSALVPEAWTPKPGSERVDGTLEHIECLGKSARFQIRKADGKPVKLLVDEPGRVLLQDASSLTFTFSCGAQRARRIAVEYDPEAGRITAIRFP